MNFDDIDQRLLAELQAEGRITNVELASRVGLTAPPCLRRVRALEESGAIRGYHADIADSGPNVSACLFIRLKTTPAPDLIAFLRRMPEVKSCTSLTGDIDLLVEISAATTDRMNALRDRISAHETVADLTTAIVLNRNI